MDIKLLMQLGEILYIALNFINGEFLMYMDDY